MSALGLGLVALGGALGAVCRFWVGIGWAVFTETELPAPTLFVNVTGSLLLGALFGLLQPDTSQVLDAPALLFAGVGFCGAYTTFSSFCTEFVSLGRHRWGLALGYLAATAIGCVGAFGAAYWLLGQGFP